MEAYTYKSISCHVKDEYLGRTDSSEIVEGGDDASVEDPQPIASVSSDAVDGDQTRAVDVPATSGMP